MTRGILFIKAFPSGWQLYGKTGGGVCQDMQGNKATRCQMGWFVGWMQKGQQQIIFAGYKQFPGKSSISMGQIVKQEALARVFK